MMEAERNTRKAQFEVELLKMREQGQASSMSRGWAAKVAETTKARIAAERHVVEAKKAEEEIRIAYKRAEEEERCQANLARIAAQAMAAKEDEIKVPICPKAPPHTRRILASQTYPLLDNRTHVILTTSQAVSHLKAKHA